MVSLLPVSDAEQCGWNYADAVCTTIGVTAGGDDDGIEELIAYPIAQPDQVSDVVVIDDRRELDLDRQNPLIDTPDDQVNLVISREVAEVRHRRFSSLRVDTYVERHQCLEQSPEEGGVSRGKGSGWVAAQQRIDRCPAKTSRECWIGELVLRPERKPREAICRGLPAWDGLDEPHAFKDVEVAEHRCLRGLLGAAGARAVADPLVGRGG